MARLIQHVVEPPHACVYLPDRQASLEYNVLVDVGPEELGRMLEHGWRRFGPMYFRPACASCTECVSLRIPSATFAPSKSQRRARKNAARLVRSMQVPVVDDERLALYGKWHAHRESERGWDPSPIDAERYAFDFAFEHPSVREVTFRDPDDGNRLVGLGIVDAVPDGYSAVYFFWAPAHAPDSLGTAHVVTLVDQATADGLPYVYLGYRVADCASLAYKGRYGPHELLEGRPDFKHLPVWRPVSPR